MAEQRSAQEVLDDHLVRSLNGSVEDDLARNYAASAGSPTASPTGRPFPPPGEQRGTAAGGVVRRVVLGVCASARATRNNRQPLIRASPLAPRRSADARCGFAHAHGGSRAVLMPFRPR